MANETDKKDGAADTVLALLSEEEIEFYKRFDIPLPSIEEVKFIKGTSTIVQFTRIERPAPPASTGVPGSEPQPATLPFPLSKPETDC